MRLLFVTLILGLVSSAAAQTVLPTAAVDNKRVILSWEKAPGDDFDAAMVDSIQENGFPERMFGRYQLWRSISPDPDTFQLVRNYSVADSTWSFVGDIRRFSDPDSIVIRGPEKDEDYDEDEYTVPGLHNGFDYYYALTWDEAETNKDFGFDYHIFHQMQTIAEGMIGPLQPQRPASAGTPRLSNVEVVPNPYNAKDITGHFPDSPRVQFVGLPEICDIEIYTVAGDLVRELSHDAPTDAENWDLKNGKEQDVASGIYIYRVTIGNESVLGRFVVIR